MLPWILIRGQERSSLLASGLLGFAVVFGTFNRITFPAFLLLPGLSLLPHFIRKPFTLLALAFSAAVTLLLAIQTDTAFFRPGTDPWRTLLHCPVLAPYNAIVYNISSKNLAEHGLHPRYQHLLVNLPLLLGPAVALLWRPIYSLIIRRLYTPLTASALSGLLALSVLPHQEPRFLLPIVPLLLSSIRLPYAPSWRRAFIITWTVFNLTMGMLMGAFHQAGVVPMQLHLGNEAALPLGSRALWWRTYSPPVWVADASPEQLQTIDLMGMKAPDVFARIMQETGTCETREPENRAGDVLLIAPDTADEVDAWKGQLINKQGREWRGEDRLRWTKLWRVGRHVGLDDLDIPGDGVWSTLKKVIGSRGLTAWRIQRDC
jgi:phosphatidylinositol glycan class Z